MGQAGRVRSGEVQRRRAWAETGGPGGGGAEGQRRATCAPCTWAGRLPTCTLSHFQMPLLSSCSCHWPCSLELAPQPGSLPSCCWCSWPVSPFLQHLSPLSPTPSALQPVTLDTSPTQASLGPAMVSVWRLTGCHLSCSLPPLLSYF